MSEPQQPLAKGRGSQLDPPNPFERVSVEPDLEHWEWDPQQVEERLNRPTEYLADASRSIVTENHSPDVPFRYSVNPYRGCAHGCSYCYARNSHEFLGFNAGLDFETKIVVKHDAPELLREFLNRKSWKPESIIFSGVTDCYQPIERRLRLTRRCLEVVQEARQPISIITKNALVVRDVDILREMAALDLVHVNISITTLDHKLARDMEPRTSIPSARLRAVRLLSEAGVPVRVLVAPLIPGLNDSEIPSILEAAAEAGAKHAGYVLLRLPATVEPVFREWLHRTQPTKAERVEGLIRQTRRGQLNRSEWGERMRGSGEIADQIERVFQVFLRRHKLDGGLPPHDCSRFRPPQGRSGQLRLF